MEPADDPENRRAQRFRVFKGATIEFSGNSIPCTVRNLSENGAALDVVSPLGIPDHFELVIVAEHVRKPCRVIWRKEKRIGIAFE